MNESIFFSLRLLLSYFQWGDSLHSFETYACQVKRYLQSSSVLTMDILSSHSLSWFGSLKHLCIRIQSQEPYDLLHTQASIATPTARAGGQLLDLTNLQFS